MCPPPPLTQMTFSRLEMESPPPSLHGRQASPSPKKRRTSAIEALLSPARRSELSPAAAAEEEEAAARPSSEAESDGDDDDDGVGNGDDDPRNRLGSVSHGVLEVLAGEEEQEEREQSEGGEGERRLDEVSLAGGSGGRRTGREAGVGRKGGRSPKLRVGGDNVELTVRVQEMR